MGRCVGKKGKGKVKIARQNEVGVVRGGMRVLKKEMLSVGGGD